MPATVHTGNVFDVLPTLKPKSVDCCVTSPPYWMLRSYLPKGHALKPLELGQEKTPAEYVSNMVRVFGMVREALADHGTCWINIGDSYSATGGHTSIGSTSQRKGRANIAVQNEQKGVSPEDVATGNLCLIPQRLMIALQDDGWIVRSIVIWHKPAPMPSSVAGWRWMRCRVKVKSQKVGTQKYSPVAMACDHSQDIRNKIGAAEWSDCTGCKKCEKTDGFVLRRGSWRPTSAYEPVIMLAKQQGYYCDGDAVKTAASAATTSRDKYTRVLDDPDEQFAVRHDHETICESANIRDVWKADLEKLSKEELLALLLDERDMNDVWTIGSEPLKEKHYAAFPSELVHRCLKAGTSGKGYCPTCGAPWARVVEKEATGKVRQRSTGGLGTEQRREPQGLAPVGGMFQEGVEIHTVGWRQSCNCEPLPARAGLVLDPFSGSGRTGVEAMRLGLDFVGVDLNPDYADMSRKILREESPLFS